MAYVADLITVLNSLFGKVTQASSSEAPKVTRQALTEVHQIHKTSDTRRKIYRRISTEFLTVRDLLFMLEVLRSLLLPSLGFDPVPRPDSGNKGKVASSSTGPGVASSSRHRPTERATPSPVTQVTQPPTQITGQLPQSTGKPPQTTAKSPQTTGKSPQTTEKPLQSTRDPASQPQSDRSSVWSRFIGCLTHPC